jgi:hypothetical protein
MCFSIPASLEVLAPVLNLNVRGPMEGARAPGNYYVLFEDPDGIRLEVNFVPSAGLLAWFIRPVV